MLDNLKLDISSLLLVNVLSEETAGATLAFNTRSSLTLRDEITFPSSSTSSLFSCASASVPHLPHVSRVCVCVFSSLSPLV